MRNGGSRGSRYNTEGKRPCLREGSEEARMGPEPGGRSGREPGADVLGTSGWRQRRLRKEGTLVWCLSFWGFWMDIASPWVTPWEIRKKRVGWRWREGWGELVCGHPWVARWSRSSAVRKQAVTVFQCFISTCVLDKKISPETYQSWFRKCAIAAALFKAVFSP